MKPLVLRWAKPVLFVAVSLVTIGILAAWVFPTRTWLDQRDSLAATSAQLEELRAERIALQEQIDELQTDAAIEARARGEYGMVRPGEEAYAVLAEPLPPIDLPPVWPFGELTPPTP